MAWNDLSFVQFGARLQMDYSSVIKNHYRRRKRDTVAISLTSHSLRAMLWRPKKTWVLPENQAVVQDGEYAVMCSNSMSRHQEKYCLKKSDDGKNPALLNPGKTFQLTEL